MNIANDILPVLKSVSQFGIDYLCCNIRMALGRDVLLNVVISHDCDLKQLYPEFQDASRVNK